MDDKELLELAAKAAGLKPTENCNGQLAWTTGIGSGCLLWNPLTDDGDRYRLAVKTRLFSANRHRLESWISSYMLQAALPYDKALAIAIVRAAAEIGRAMP